jgi:hypothetical protein
MQKTIAFELMTGDRAETENTRKFKEVPASGEPRVIGTLYVQKFLLEQAGNPRLVTMTLDL